MTHSKYLTHHRHPDQKVNKHRPPAKHLAVPRVPGQALDQLHSPRASKIIKYRKKHQSICFKGNFKDPDDQPYYCIPVVELEYKIYN